MDYYKNTMTNKNKFPPLFIPKDVEKATGISVSLYPFHGRLINAIIKSDSKRFPDRSVVMQSALEEFAIQMGIEIPE
jgi:hypothetical protein